MSENVRTLCGKLHSKSNISKHRKTCLKCIKYEQSERRRIQEEKCEIDQLKARLDELEKQPKTTNVFVNIIPFSQEPMLSQETIEDLLEPASDCVPKYVKQKHFLKAGGNIRIPNKSQKRIQVLCEEAGEKIWVTKDRDDFIKNLTGISMTELDEKYGASTISENYRRWATRFNNSDKIIQQKLDNQILYTILDNQTYDK